MVHRLLGLLILSSITILLISIPFKGTFINVVSGQAVPLIPLTGGNATLNSGIPKFYNCIEKEVKASKNVNDDPYFKSEPTKAEVFKCYNMIFKESEQESVS
jgi:hypothetical protein